MAYSCCFSLGGNLDFLDSLQKWFITSTKGYNVWETDEVIAYELYRNLGLATLCIFVVTFCLFANIVDSVLVLLMVIMSIVDVCGFMHLWNVTIDTVRFEWQTMMDGNKRFAVSG